LRRFLNSFFGLESTLFRGEKETLFMVGKVSFRTPKKRTVYDLSKEKMKKKRGRIR